MTQETERLKTELLAAEVEIARLQSGFDDLSNKLISEIYSPCDSYAEGYNDALTMAMQEINRITGTKK